jgi:hypothetical protein
MKNIMEKAISLITNEMLDSITYGEEIELNDEYTLYHYTEDDIVVLVLTDEWQEVATILREDNGGITYEMCD